MRKKNVRSLKKPRKIKGRGSKGSFLNSIIFLGLLAFGANWSYNAYINRLDFSTKASPAFKARIKHVLNYIKESDPETFKTIQRNVHLIADKNSFRSSVYKKANTDQNSGYIGLNTGEFECPSSLKGDEELTKRCAAEIYRNALHLYHINNNIYASKSLEGDYETYVKGLEFYQKLGGNDRQYEKHINAKLKEISKEMRMQRRR